VAHRPRKTVKGESEMDDPEGRCGAKGRAVLLQPPSLYPCVHPLQRREDHSWCPLCSIWLDLHHLCPLPSPPPMGLEVFAQHAAMLFRGVQMQVPNSQWQELKSSPLRWAMSKGKQPRAARVICSKSLPV